MSDDRLADEVESRNRVYVERDELRARVAELERERDAALLNSKAIDEAEFMRRIDERLAGREVPDVCLTPLGKTLVGTRAERNALAAEVSALRDVLTAVLPYAVQFWRRGEQPASCISEAHALLDAPSSAAAVLSARDEKVRRVALEEAAHVAAEAKLPDGYQWGRDAMWSFHVGARQAAVAVRALAAKPTLGERYQTGLKVRRSIRPEVELPVDDEPPAEPKCANPSCVDGRVPGELAFSDPCPVCTDKAARR